MQNTAKNKIITSLLISAVLFSVLASYLIYHYMAPSRSTIYVFNDAYPSGTQISAEMLTPIQVDSNIIVAGKKTNTGNAFVTPSGYQEVVKSGDSLRMDVSEGMPLTTSMLSVSGGSTVEMNMKSDAIAVTVEVDEFTGITNDLKAGSRVNIYANIDSSVVLIQQNKRVLEVFKKDGQITGVSIEENIQESTELIYAVTNGKIYLGLVDATGYQSSEGSDPEYSPYLEEQDYLSTDISKEENEIEEPANTEETDDYVSDDVTEEDTSKNEIFTP